MEPWYLAHVPSSTLLLPYKHRTKPPAEVKRASIRNDFLLKIHRKLKEKAELQISLYSAILMHSNFISSNVRYFFAPDKFMLTPAKKYYIVHTA